MSDRAGYIIEVREVNHHPHHWSDSPASLRYTLWLEHRSRESAEAEFLELQARFPATDFHLTLMENLPARPVFVAETFSLLTLQEGWGPLGEQDGRR